MENTLHKKPFNEKEYTYAPSFFFENQLCHDTVAGVDEVGYGAWSGPIVVAAVVCCPHAMPKDFLIQINDSKKMTHGQRLSVFQAFVSCPEMGHYAVCSVPVHDINKNCVLKCTLGAMAHVVQSIGAKAVLVDGVHSIPCDIPQNCLKNGDQKSFSIALASIIAKVVRDREMMRLAIDHPLFHWDQNKGYGTLLHRRAIQRKGLTPHHRIKYCRRVF